MAKKRQHFIDLAFPIKGLDRFWANRKQPLLTTPDALNVRAADPIASRSRGGQRPGIVRAYPHHMGSETGSPSPSPSPELPEYRTYVRMLGQVTRVKLADTYTAVDEDNFNRANSGVLGAGWEPADWWAHAMQVFENQACDAGMAWSSANVRRPLLLSDLNEYSVAYDINKPLGVKWQRSIKHLYARMDDINPNALIEGIDLVFVTEMADEFIYSGELRVRMAGVVVATHAFAAGSLGLGVTTVRLGLRVLGNNVTVTLDGATLWDGAVVAQPGMRVGMGSTMLGVHFNPNDNWMVTGTLVAGEPVENETRLVASTGGRLYAETTPGELARIADPDAIFSSNHSFMCVEQGGRLWIADYGGTSVPKVYDPGDNSVAEWTAAVGKGTCPQHCRLICLYRNRIVLASPPGAMREWYMSHVDDPRDWNYADATVLGAVAGTAANAGQLGEELRALIPYSDDYLIFGCAHSIWMMSGDPRYGGVLDAVDYKTGILDKFAWCHDPEANVWFMGRAGLYRMRPKGGTPEPMSPATLPTELSNINTQALEVFLAWDTVRFGLYIFVTSRLDGTSRHWFYDARQDAFWPDQIPNDHGPTAVLDYGADSARFRKLLLGGRDGYIRNFAENVANDDGEAIESYVVFAPQRVFGKDDREGILQLVQLALGRNTDSVDYEIRVADTHEEAVIAVPKVNRTLRGGGLKSPERMRIRGGSMALRLSNDTLDENWAYEKGFARSVDGGIVRMGQGRKLLQPISNIPTPPDVADEPVPPSPITPSPSLPPYPTPTPTIPPPTPTPTPTPTPSPTPTPTPTPTPSPTISPSLSPLPSPWPDSPPSGSPGSASPSSASPPSGSPSSASPLSGSPSSASPSVSGPHECCGDCYTFTAGAGTKIIACSITPEVESCGATEVCTSGNCTYNETAVAAGGAGLKQCGEYCSGGGVFVAYDYASDNCAY